MWGIFIIIAIIVVSIMAYVTYKSEQKEKERIRVEEEERIRKEKEREEKIHSLKNELKNIDAEMDPILYSVKSKNQAQIEELEKKRNEICVGLYALTGKKTSYKGRAGLFGVQFLELEYQKIDIQHTKEKQKQEEKERLIQQQIRQKQQKKAESRAAYLAGWAIANAVIEKNNKEQKQKQQEKELKEMKEMLKKLNKK